MPANTRKPRNKSSAFEWISNESTEPFVSLDKQKRLYISARARKVMQLSALEPRVIVGYDAANRRLVIAKPDIVRAAGITPFKIDKKSYCSAKPIIEKINVADSDLPIRYFYVGRDFAEYAEGAFAFGQEGVTGADD